MIANAFPIVAIDLVGSILMIVFSFLSLHLVLTLKRLERNNVIWTYLLMFCFGLAAFAISRSAGHIVKQLLLLSGNETIWRSIRPYSGAINSFMFVFVASVTLFFERVWNIYQQIMKDKQALQSAHQELLFLNQNLESLVTARTEALTHSEHKYRRIFEVSRDMIMVAQGNGSILEINPVGRQMLGYSDSDSMPVGEPFQNFFSNLQDWENIHRSLIKESFVLNAEMDLKSKDGAMIQCLVSASLDKAVSTNEDTIHFLIKDIHQRKLLEQQMAKADKLASIGQLSAGIAHEINNPLGVILGYTQLLQRNKSDEAERFQDLRTIEKHVKNCKTIVEDLLNFARSSDPEKEMVNIHDTIDDTLSFIQHNSAPDKIKFNKSYDGKIPAMLLDDKKIRQVFINLVMNAKHAIGESGEIFITTRYQPKEEKVCINIKDTGHGIEEKNLSRIFDPFFTTKPTGVGTGLGLSVGYGIIKNHGGDIFVESIPGKETTFTVSLPVTSRSTDNTK